jgi:hypothetical protein
MTRALIRLFCLLGASTALLFAAETAKVPPPAAVPAPSAVPALPAKADAKPVDANAPVIELSGKVFDFGELYEGAKFSQILMVKNVGKTPLIIEEIRKCACLSYEIDKMTVAPGEQAVVQLVMDLTRMAGPTTKNFFLKVNDPATPIAIIQFTGKVIPTISMKPLGLFFEMPKYDLKSTKSVRLSAGPDQEFKVLDVSLEGNKDVFTAQFETVTAGREYNISVTAKTPATARETNVIIVRTDHPKKPEIRIPLVATLAKDYHLTPGKIILRKNRPAPGSIYISMRGGAVKKFDITEVVLPPGSATSSIVKLPGGRGYRIRISGLHPDASLEGQKVVLKSTLKDHPLIEIPIELK